MYKNKKQIRKGLRCVCVALLCLSMLQWPCQSAAAVGKTSCTVAKRTKKTAVLRMNKISGVTGYQVFVAGARKGKYRQMGATRTTSFTLKKLKKNKIYYIKVRAYKTSGTRIITGKYSAAVKVAKYKTQTTADQYAAKVLELVNQERKKEGLKALKASAALNRAANIRARELVTQNSPTRPDGRNGCSVLTDEDIVYKTAGENIASGAATPQEVVAQWMGDAGHKAQIMSEDYTYMGLGYYATTKGDKYYWSQLFMAE